MEEKSHPKIRGNADEKSSARLRDVGKGATSMPLPETVGAIFRTARESQRLSQEQVAELTNGRSGQISRTAISDIERGKCLPGLEAFVSLSRALKIEPAEVLERVDLASAVPVDLTDLPLEDLLKRGEEFLWAGDYRKALSVYDAMLDRLVLCPPENEDERRRWHSRLEVNRAVALRRCSAVKAAQAAAQRAVELSGGMPELQAEAYMVFASVLSHEGHLTLAGVASDQAIALSAETNATLKGRAWSQRGNVLFRMGRHREAREAFLKSAKLLRQTDRYHDQIKVEGNLGACSLELGQRSQAGERFKKAIELARKFQAPAAEAFWLIELGRTALDDGKLDEADAYGQASLRIAKPADQFLTIFRAEWLLHLVVKARDPKATDRNRLAYLRKLYVRVQEHQGLSVIKEFETTVLNPSEEQGRRSS